MIGSGSASSAFDRMPFLQKITDRIATRAAELAAPLVADLLIEHITRASLSEQTDEDILLVYKAAEMLLEDRGYTGDLN